MKQRIDRELSPFWSAELAQIYPALERLREGGWVADTAVAPSRGPASRRYRATAAGRRELLAWLRQPFRTAPVRDAALARYVLGRAMGVPGAPSADDVERELAGE